MCQKSFVASKDKFSRFKESSLITKESLLLQTCKNVLSSKKSMVIKKVQWIQKNVWFENLVLDRLHLKGL